MVRDPELLRTISEISIGFAGFSGVVAAFSRFRLHPEARFYRVRTMVSIGLFVLLFSLLPLVLSEFPIPADAGWRISTAILALGVGIMLVWIRRGVRPLYEARILHTQGFTAVMTLVFAAVLMGLLIGVFGPWQRLAEGMYVGTLFLGLFMCSYYFFMLISAIELERES